MLNRFKRFGSSKKKKKSQSGIELLERRRSTDVMWISYWLELFCLHLPTRSFLTKHFLILRARDTGLNEEKPPQEALKKSADMSTQTEGEAVGGGGGVGGGGVTTLNLNGSNPERPFQNIWLNESTLRLSGGSVSNFLPYHGQSIRGRKRGPTDLSASMELQGLLRNSSELLNAHFSLKSSTDSFSHASAVNHSYQATIFPQIPPAPPVSIQQANPSYHHRLYPTAPYSTPYSGERRSCSPWQCYYP